MIVMSSGTGMDVGMLVDSKFGCRNAGLDDAIDRDVPAFDGEAAKRARQRLERQAGIEQRADDHVAGGTRKTVEVKNLQSSSSCLKL